jgi:hypothetical protein
MRRRWRSTPRCAIRPGCRAERPVRERPGRNGDEARCLEVAPGGVTERSFVRCRCRDADAAGCRCRRPCRRPLLQELHYRATAALGLGIGTTLAAVLLPPPRELRWLALTVPAGLIAEIALSRGRPVRSTAASRQGAAGAGRSLWSSVGLVRWCWGGDRLGGHRGSPRRTASGERTLVQARISILGPSSHDAVVAAGPPGPLVTAWVTAIRGG